MEFCRLWQTAKASESPKSKTEDVVASEEGRPSVDAASGMEETQSEGVSEDHKDADDEEVA